MSFKGSRKAADFKSIFVFVVVIKSWRTDEPRPLQSKVSADAEEKPTGCLCVEEGGLFHHDDFEWRLSASFTSLLLFSPVGENVLIHKRNNNSYRVKDAITLFERKVSGHRGSLSVVSRTIALSV